MPRDSSLLTPADCAHELGVCEKTIRRLVQKGDLPPVRIGVNVRIERAELEKFIRGSREGRR